jgi:phage terminase large subunit GpA-like protein
LSLASRPRRHIYAIKAPTVRGRSGRAGKSRRYGGSLVWTVGVDTIKDAIYSRLRSSDPGLGYCHFLFSYELDYFKQLTSEQVRTKFIKGHHRPPSRRGHPNRRKPLQSSPVAKSASDSGDFEKKLDERFRLT